MKKGGEPRTGLAGDFLALLSEEGLLFPSGNVTRDGIMPVETQATTVFAFHFADGVLMVGDRRATAGNMIVSDSVDKVMELDRTSLLAIAGVPATAFEMVRVLQHSFEYYRRSQLQPLSLSAKVRALARLIRENVPMALQGVGIVSPLFAGVESGSAGRPKIFFYDPLGAQFQAVDFAAAGSGSQTVRSVLGFQSTFGQPRPTMMGLDEAILFGLRLLLTAADFDSATGGVDPARADFATLKVLRSTGIESIDGARQAALMGKGSA